MIKSIVSQFVEYIPPELENGVLYISDRFATASHRCACGCGLVVVTPLKPTHWKLINKDGRVSLKPSIGNWSFPCQSHYWIRNNGIEWAPKWSKSQIEKGREYDARERDHYLNRRYEERQLSIWARIRRFFGF